jgi:hypothetical protein
MTHCESIWLGTVHFCAEHLVHHVTGGASWECLVFQQTPASLGWPGVFLAFSCGRLL